MPLRALAGTTWRGRAELWLDPLGDVAEWSDCAIYVHTDRVAYEWARGDTAHHGEIALVDAGATFTDTFHASTTMRFDIVTPTGALLELRGSYAAGEGPPWGWRIVAAFRPAVMGLTEALVLQMTNIAPWGEEVRAVRMTGARSPR